MSSLIGAKPNLWHLLMTDPVLAFRCFFGPCIPAQYRLVGPGAWPGARDIIMGVQESKLCPLRTRKTGPKEGKDKNSTLSWLFCLLILLILFLLISTFWDFKQYVRCNFGSVQEHIYLQLSFFSTSVCLCEWTLSASSLGWFIIFNEKKKISSSRKISSKAPQKKKLLKFVDIVLSGRKMN